VVIPHVVAGGDEEERGENRLDARRLVANRQTKRVRTGASGAVVGDDA
jgi:hypothetical protein